MDFQVLWLLLLLLLVPLLSDFYVVVAANDATTRRLKNATETNASSEKAIVRSNSSRGTSRPRGVAQYRLPLEVPMPTVASRNYSSAELRPQPTRRRTQVVMRRRQSNSSSITSTTTTTTSTTSTTTTTSE